MNYLSKDNVEDVVSLSPTQEVILLHALPDHLPTVTQVRYHVKGRLDPELFQQAWHRTVLAHAATRTIFRPMKNRTVGVVLKTRPIPMSIIDVRHHPTESRESAITEQARDQLEPFDATTGPLMRAALFVTGPYESVLLWTYHRAILDEPSEARFLADLVAFYDGIADDTESHLTRPGYREYGHWLAQQDWAPAGEYWGRTMAGLKAPTQVAIEPESYSGRPTGRASQTVTLARDRTQALEQLAHRQSVDEGAILQAAWTFLLGVYSGEDDVSFGLWCDGRPTGLPGNGDIVGPFATTVPFRVHLNHDQRLADFLRDVQRQSDALRAHAYSSLVDIRACTDISDDLPLFTTTLTFVRPLSIADGSSLSFDRETATHDRAGTLTVDAVLNSEWELTLASDGSVVGSAALSRMTAQLETLLGQMVANPDVRLAEIEFLPEEERERILLAFNAPSAGDPLDRPVHQIIEERAAADPDAIAVVHAGDSATYRELNARSNRFAAVLRARGFGRNDLAALFAERSIDMLVAILGIAKAGGAYVPLDPAYPDERLSALLTTCQAKIVVTRSDLAQRTLELGSTLSHPPLMLCLDEASYQHASPEAAPRGSFPTNDLPSITRPDNLANPPCGLPSITQAADLATLPSITQPQDLANVFFTSGSTGVPKGAMIEHQGMLNHLWAKIRVLDLSPESVVAQNASHCFDISVWQFLAPLMVGGKVVIYDGDVAGDPDVLLSAMQRDGVTVLELVPTMIDLLLQASADRPPEERPLPGLRYLVSTGETLPPKLCRRWLQMYPNSPVVNAYGATECSDDTTHEMIAVPPCETQSYATVGRPIPNVTVYILDRWQRPVPLGCTGEICFSGIAVGRGYLADPERTGAAFVGNPFDLSGNSRMYRTGDLGHFLPDGRIVCSGRLDHQVKVRGHRIELGDIEAALQRHPAVLQCVAIVRPDAQGQNQLLAYVVLDDTADASSPRELLQRTLPAYMIPEHIMQLRSLPLDRNGKVDRKALPHPAANHPDAERTRPRDETEAALTAIWEAVLEIPEVGIEDGFFELGGHSLKAIQVRSRIKRQMGVDVPLQTFFQHQTVRALAPVIQALQPHADGPNTLGIRHLAPAPHYPMSHAQQRLWFLQQLDPDGCSYSMPAALEIEGELDVHALLAALQRVVDRHASLRTTFSLVDGQPVQRVADQQRLHCPVDDLSALATEDRPAVLDNLMCREALAGFDLEVGPLFRVRLVKLDREHHTLILNMHHIISDAWSWEVLEREWAELYHAFRDGLPDPLPPLAIQYVDYSQWQNNRLTSGALEQDERYWLEQLSGPLPVLDLPADHPRPEQQSYRGHTYHRMLDARVLARMSAICEQREVTLFMALLGATGAYLSRLSGQDDIILGSPVAGRDREETEDLIGFFVNTLPLRLRIDGDPTFLALLEHVKATALEAYSHQEYPFDQLVDRLNPLRDLSRPPIFSVMFQVNRNTSEVAMSDLTLRRHSLRTEQARFDLTVVFTEMADGLDCCLEYNSDLFEEATIARFAGHLSRLIEGIAANPDSHLSELPLLTGDEETTLLKTWNATETAFPEDSCIHELFEAQVERTPNAIAVRADDGELTYRELNARADRLAGLLQAWGAGPEVRVGICLHRSTAMVVAMLATLKAGAAYLPLDPSYPEERLEYMMRDADASVLITERGLMGRVPAHTSTVVCMEELDLEAGGAAPKRLARPEQLAYVIYTSGSTGRPKGVMIEHRSVINFLCAMRDRLGVTAEDVILSVTTLSFDIAVLELFLPLIVGGSVDVVSREVSTNGERLAARLESAGATILQATPSTWRLLLATGWRNDGRISMLCGGEALASDLAAQLEDTAAPLWNLYGPTETTVWSTIYRVTAATRGVEPIGRPIANTQVYLLDADMHPAPVGLPGEVFLGGAGLARGYHDRPDLTAERFIPDPFGPKPGARLYRTGDLARYRADGTIEFLGRMDHQVKVRGFRIELGEIEVALRTHPEVSEAVVAARQDVQEDQRLVAYLVPSADPAPASSELRAFLGKCLPAHMVPSLFIPLDALPLTPNGKVDRKALPAPAASVPIDHSYVAPRDGLELAVARVWEEILGVRPVSVLDSFFALGGHSLTAVALVEAMTRRLEAQLPLPVLFRGPTVAEVCTYLREGAASVPSCLIPLHADGTAPPLFLVHPQGGGALCYLDLAADLDGTATVYGLQAPGYDTAEEPLSTVEAMADRYIEEIRSVAPHGPYRLGGWSLGGLVAVEIAGRLEDAGEDIAFLGLLDTSPPRPEIEDDSPVVPAAERAVVELAEFHLGIDRSELDGLEKETQLALILARAQQLELVPREATIETVRRQLRVIVANQAALDSYRCSAILRADIHLFRASELHPHDPGPLVDPNGWRRHSSAGVCVVPLRGNHYDLVRPPQVEALAAAIAEALQGNHSARGAQALAS